MTVLHQIQRRVILQWSFLLQHTTTTAANCRLAMLRHKMLWGQPKALHQNMLQPPNLTATGLHNEQLLLLSADSGASAAVQTLQCTEAQINWLLELETQAQWLSCGDGRSPSSCMGHAALSLSIIRSACCAKPAAALKLDMHGTHQQVSNL